VGVAGHGGGEVGAPTASVVTLVADEAVAQLPEPVELGDVGDILHRVPEVQGAVAARAERLVLGARHERVGVDEGAEHQRRDHDDQEVACRLLPATLAVRDPLGGACPCGRPVGGRVVAHQNLK
jgi:hypothetical protein